MEKTYTQMKNNEMALQVFDGNSLFDFNGNNVEVFVVDGKEYFNMTHVGNVLEIKNIHDTTKNYNEFYKVKLTNEILENSGIDFIYTRKLNNFGEMFLTESGLYRVIFRSNKPQALEFQQWVFCEVLPQIRRTGGYIPVNVDDTQETIEQRAKEIASKTIAIKDELIAQQQARIEQLEEENEQQQFDIDTYKEDVRYLFRRTDYGVHSISEAFQLVTHDVNGKRNFVQWFKDNNNGYVTVLDEYVDEYGSKKRNVIDLTEIRTFHKFKDLCFEFIAERDKKEIR